MSHFERFELTNAGDGALVRQFEAAVREVLADLQDPLKEYSQKRTIAMKVVFAPSGGDQIRIAVQTEVKLAKPAPEVSMVLLTPCGGLEQLRNTEHQTVLDITPQKAAGGIA